ncbi:MAG: CBS domain-containing protein [Pirellulaceae bacterium]|nr:CBS domain-containing protein [Pirellulaceae bacterium]
MADDAPTEPDQFEDPLSNYEPVEYATEFQRVLAEESVSIIRSKPFVQLTADSSIREATQALAESKVSSLLVVEDQKLVGIFTERDFLEKVAEQFPQKSTSPVREVMTSDPMVVYETDPIGTAVAAIAVAGHRHVPVLKMDGTVMGILSPKRVLACLREHLD